jgi:hypothetical protein
MQDMKRKKFINAKLQLDRRASNIRKNARGDRRSFNAFSK